MMRLTAALLAMGLLVGCPDEESETTPDEEGTAGGEDTEGGGGGGGGTAGGGDDGEWDGDPAGGGGTAGGGTQTGTQPGPQENPWGSPVAEQGRPLPPRRPMNSSARNAYQQGVSAAASGNNAAAVSAFQQALSADPQAYQAAYNLGVLADRAGNTAQALEYYQRALRLQADYERAAEGIVTIHLRRGNTAEAISFIEPLARQWERNLYLQAILAETLVAANRPDDAWEAARRALRRDERFVPAMIALIKASLKQGRKELAEGILDQALAVDQNNAELHYLKAKLLLQEEGRLRDAITELRRTIELQPDHAEARMALGIQMLNGANYAEALQHFQVAAQLVPTLVAVHLNLAEAYRSNRQWQQAKQAYDQALRMQPNLPEARYNMALMYMQAGAEFPGMTALSAMQKAVEEFTAYRNMMGPRLARDDPSQAYLEDLNRQIEREQRRLERERARAPREGAAEGGGGG